VGDNNSTTSSPCYDIKYVYRFLSVLGHNGLLDDLGKKGQKMDVILKHVETTEFFSEDYFFTSRSDCVGITEVRT